MGICDGAVDGHLTRHRFPAGPRCAENVTKILIVGGDPGASVGNHSEVLAIGADCACARNIPDVPRDVDGASAAILGGVITVIGGISSNAVHFYDTSEAMYD